MRRFSLIRGAHGLTAEGGSEAGPKDRDDDCPGRLEIGRSVKLGRQDLNFRYSNARWKNTKTRRMLVSGKFYRLHLKRQNRDVCHINICFILIVGPILNTREMPEIMFMGWTISPKLFFCIKCYIYKHKANKKRDTQGNDIYIRGCSYIT